MKYFAVVLALSIALFLNSCDQGAKPQVYNETITQENLPELVDKMKEDPKVSNEDIQYFTQGLNFTPVDTVKGKTVGDVIEMQKERVRNSNFQVATQSAKKTQMYMHHHFKFIGLQPNDQENAAFNKLAYEITNISKKTITKIQGQLKFFNNQNQIVKIFNVNINKEIGPEETIRYAENFAHDPENNRDSIIRNNINRLKGRWEPLIITFADGESLSIAQE